MCCLGTVRSYDSLTQQIGCIGESWFESPQVHRQGFYCFLQLILQAGRSRFGFPVGSLYISLFTYSYQPHCGPWVVSVSNRNEYRNKHGRCLRPTTSRPSVSRLFRKYEYKSLDVSQTCDPPRSVTGRDLFCLPVPQANSGIVSQIRPCPLPSICFLIVHESSYRPHRMF
jgi:hypothetical protein